MSKPNDQRLFQTDPRLGSAKVSPAVSTDKTFDIKRYVDGTFVNVASFQDALAKIKSHLDAQRGFAFFTLNLDHLSKLKRSQSFRAFYDNATFVSADGWPVALLTGRRDAKVLRTTGADLIFPVCDLAARTDLPIYLFGSTEQILAKAAAELETRYPGLRIIGQAAPPFGFDPRSASAVLYARDIAQSGARLCFVALGAPTQEAFADLCKDLCPLTGFFCIGAALDFVAGAQQRAPKIFQKTGLEWAWRLALAPRRLGLRYVQSACVFAELVVGRITAPGARRP